MVKEVERVATTIIIMMQKPVYYCTYYFCCKGGNKIFSPGMPGVIIRITNLISDQVNQEQKKRHQKKVQQ
jgi:hypothetical protein